MGRRTLILFGVLLATHLAWRVVRYALDFPVWGDEAFVLASLWDRGYAELFAPLEYGQIAPLGWLWLEKACFALFGPREWALRLPAFLAGLASALLMLRLARRVLPGRAGLLGFAVFAASYYPVRHAAEIKPYATDLLWALLLLNLAWDAGRGGLRREPSTAAGRVRWIALGALCVAAPWVSLSALFPAAAVAAWALWRARPGAAAGAPSPPRVPALAAGAAFAASAAAMVLAYAAPHAAAADWLRDMAMWEPTFPPLEQPWRLPLWWLERHGGYMSAYPTGGRNWGSSATFLLIAAGTVRLWRGGRRELLWLLLGPLVFNLGAAALERYPYGGSVRVSIFMAPAFCLLAGAGLDALVERLRLPAARRAETALCLLLAAVPLAGIAGDLAEPYKLRSDRRAEELAAWLRERVGPRDRVVAYAYGADEAAGGGAGGVDFHALGGSLARLRFQLRRALPVPVEWGAAPLPGEREAATQDSAPPRVWLLAYDDDRHGEFPFPAQAFGAYRRRWNQEAGMRAPEAPRVFALQEDETVTVWRLEPARGAQTPPR